MLAAETDAEMREYLRQRARRARSGASPSSRRELKELLIPKDPNDGKNVIVEIRGAEGGEEANLWAGDLYQMYQHYAERAPLEDRAARRASRPTWAASARSRSCVKGDDAWSRLKHEAGPHRVQRVPVTESQGRIHTSAATVAVLPEAEEVDVDVDPNDLEIDVYRSTGPGGQSVNTTDSAVRMTHKPTGPRRHLPGREEPAPEQGQGAADPAVAAAPGRAGAAGRRSCRTRAGAR